MGNITSKAIEETKQSIGTELVNDLLGKIDKLSENTTFTSDTLKELFGNIIKESDSHNTQKSYYDLSFQKSAPIFAFNDRIVLRPFSVNDKLTFFKLSREWSSLLTGTKENDPQLEFYWERTQNDASFYCMIELMPDKTPIGYIAIKDTGKEPWEIAIELDKDCCHKGYGSKSIMLFLDSLTKLTGKKEYQAIIEVDNKASQQCFEKLGAKLVGCRPNKLLTNESFRAEFEDSHIDLIDEHMILLADRLNVEPKKLLSHYLDYRIITNISGSAW